jgi:hypothetical protein
VSFAEDVAVSSEVSVASDVCAGCTSVMAVVSKCSER